MTSMYGTMVYGNFAMCVLSRISGRLLRQAGHAPRSSSGADGIGSSAPYVAAASGYRVYDASESCWRYGSSPRPTVSKNFFEYVHDDPSSRIVIHVHIVRFHHALQDAFHFAKQYACLDDPLGD